MVGNKKRLYISLYPSGVTGNEERKYHWAFIIGPKAEPAAEVPGTRIHVKNTVGQVWTYEEVPLRNVKNTANLLARILIAKIEDEARLLALMRAVSLVQDDPNWRCRTWVRQALEAVAQDGKAVGTGEVDWDKIEKRAREYVGEKIDKGRYKSGADVDKPKPV